MIEYPDLAGKSTVAIGGPCVASKSLADARPADLPNRLAKGCGKSGLIWGEQSIIEDHAAIALGNPKYNSPQIQRIL
ncbi:hypothetical protein CEJ86_32225 [Sinorhizobium meliloti]|uniref:Uncharacterized protein n=1 Tax=Rhizobium meliloti TaxID=382 RepID=A0A2J0YT29_RHIML|nr:hypothetical protein CEJ86_32225 [Sinorhizobium meliloti]